jgi:hypothetical protein
VHPTAAQHADAVVHHDAVYGGVLQAFGQPNSQARS